MVAVALVGCADSGPSTSGAPNPTPNPTSAPSDHDEATADLAPDPGLEAAGARAVTVTVGVCGAAGPGLGSGIALGPDRVLTAAHVVASGGEIELSHRGRTVPAMLEAYDPRRDLAIVRPETELSSVPRPPVFVRAEQDQPVTIVGAGTSGRIPATVITVTRIEIDEVRGTERSIRDGYILEAAATGGDSGAGLYDPGGRLVGTLFAVSTEQGGRSWATAAQEIELFLAEPEHGGSFRCDPEQSQVERES